MSGSPTSDETPLVALLRTWQSHARELLADVRPRPHPEGVLPADELAARAAALRRLRWTLLPRESRKERFLSPVLRQHLDDGDDVVNELRDRKLSFERQLVVVRWVDERSQLLDDELASFIEQVLDYLGCEQQLLPRIATQVPTAEQDEAMRRLVAPNRWPVVQPHPDLPKTPWLASAIEPVAAALDRLRDRLSTAPG
jgi:hypothetical protein